MRGSRRRLIGILSVGIAAIVAATSVRAAEQKVAIDELPDAVRTALNKIVGSGTISEIEREDEDGQVVYEVEATVDGKNVELEFSATGELLETETADDDGDDDGESEQEMKLSELPQAVQAALGNAIPGVEVDEVTREVEGGHVYYEVEYEANGTDHTIELTENGDIVETETEVSASALPAGVIAYLQSHYEGAKIEEAELVTLQFYEIELENGRRDVEVQVLANGQVIEIEDDGDDD